MMINLQPRLSNNIVRLRPLQEVDKDLLYQVAKDPLIWEQHPCHDRYKPDIYDVFFEDAMQSGGALVILNKENNTIIGSSRYKLIASVDNAIEIGWSFLSRAYWGGRYNKAVKTLMINHALDHFQYVVLYIAIDNIRSQRAAEKIGAIRASDEKYKYLLKKGSDDFAYVIDSKIER